MRTALRLLGVVAALATTIGMPSTPASAQGAVVFTGRAHINCFGCGSSSGTASLSVAGEVNGVVHVGSSASATYDVWTGPGVTCLISGTATGSVTGSVNVSFNWTRVGAVAVITTTGDINGAGVAAFVVTSPVIPCGGEVDATVAGTVAGV